MDRIFFKYFDDSTLVLLDHTFVEVNFQEERRFNRIICPLIVDDFQRSYSM